MRKKKSLVVFFVFLNVGILHANDYYWDLINSLINGDLRITENIINENIASMSLQDKRLLMSFTLTYSRGANTENVIIFLVSKNILPNSFDLYTALNVNQSTSVIQLLMRYGAVPNGEVLLLAMERQRFDLAGQFIETGVDVNYKYALTRNDADGMTPLLYACKWDNFEITKLLIENGADINARAVDGNTPLTLAETNGNDEIYDYLIDRGARVTANSPSRNTGITDVLDNQTANFQPGTYRLYGGNNSMRLSGTAASGSVSYVNMTAGRVLNGIYRLSGNNLTISLEGYTFIYRIDSDDSFSGNGERWVRVVN